MIGENIYGVGKRLGVFGIFLSGGICPGGGGGNSMS